MFERFDVQRLLQQIADVQSTTFIIKDLEHRFLLVSEGLSAALGLSDEQMVGKNDLEIGFPERLVLGNSETGYPGFWALDDQAIAAGHSQRKCESGIVYDAHGVHETDSSFQTDTVRTPLFDRNGEVVGLLVQSSDISELVDLRESLCEKTAVLASRTGYLSALDDVIASLISQRDLPSLLQQVAQAIVSHTFADSAFVCLLHETGDYLEVVESVSPVPGKLMGQRLERGEGVVGRAWDLGETVYLENTELRHGTRRLWPPGTELCAVPMFGDNGVCGMLLATTSAGLGRFEHEMTLFEKLADVAAIAIVNAQQADATGSELNRARAMSDLGRLLSSDTNPASDFDTVCRTLLRALDVSHASVYLADQTGVLVPHATWAKTDDILERAQGIPASLIGETICQWCHDQRESAQIARDANDPRETSMAYDRRVEFNVGSTLCAPILTGGDSIGVLMIYRDRDRRNLHESEVHVFDTIVNQLSATLTRHDLTAALHHQAHHDSLTQLPNRLRFEIELTQTLSDPARYGHSGAVLFLDLDGFKLVNDTQGHGVGDRLLQQVSARLASMLGADDVLARMGGDEFAVILRGVVEHAQAVQVGDRLMDVLVCPFDIEGLRLKVGTSIGISYYPDGATTVDDLLRQADLAMYQAKSDGKGRILSFDQTLGSDSRRRSELELELRVAIEHRQFTLVYQPQVSCANGTVIGVEALVRWQHPERGTILPGEFIPIAERTGLISTIGAWVLDEAMRQLAGWHGTALGDLWIGVNVAASQLMHDAFPDEVLETLRRHAIDPRRLMLEVTESVVMQDVDTVIRRLDALRTAGVRIAVDDFGTGYSSLSYLQDLPLDQLKIDQSFIARLSSEARDQSLVNTILLLAAGLGLETVAEGVETPEQAIDVGALGCDFAQGHHFSYPVPADALADVMQRMHSGRMVSPPLFDDTIDTARGMRDPIRPRQGSRTRI